MIPQVIGPGVQAGVGLVSRIGPQALGGAVSALAPVESALTAKAAKAVTEFAGVASRNGAVEGISSLALA